MVDDSAVELSPGIVTSKKGMTRFCEPGWPEELTVRLVLRVGT